jgi:peptide-methionine (S)-S-oxide reductase
MDMTDPLFKEAVDAVDTGNLARLKELTAEHPRLLREKLLTGDEGYFKDPYLLYFVADNPIRVDKLAPNIVDITRFLIGELKRHAIDSLPQQLEYTLGLVATGRIPRECGVQIELIDLLIDAGVKPGGVLGVLAHHNIDAAAHLIAKGGTLNLAAAVGLERMADIERLGSQASPAEKLDALTVAAFYGRPDMVSLLLGMGADPNGYPQPGTGFHTHATPLHQAICSGSLDCVKRLVEAGAKLDAVDKAYDSTPLGWAMHMQTEEGYGLEERQRFAAIEAYLRGNPFL